MINVLKKFIEKNNKLPKTTSEIFNHNSQKYDIGQWINTQRQNYKKQLLLKHEICELEAIPFWVWSEYKEKDSFQFKCRVISSWFIKYSDFPKIGDKFEYSQIYFIEDMNGYFQISSPLFLNYASFFIFYSFKFCIFLIKNLVLLSFLFMYLYHQVYRAIVEPDENLHVFLFVFSKIYFYF